MTSCGDEVSGGERPRNCQEASFETEPCIRLQVDVGRLSNVAPKVVDTVVDLNDVCTAPDKAPHLQIAGSSSASAFLGNIRTVSAIDSFFRNPLLVLLTSKYPQEGREAFVAPWIHVLAKPH